MKEFQIVIPTHKRPNKQITLKNIPESIREDVLLVVACQEDYDIIRTYHKNVIISPTRGIAQKRQWIMENIQARKIYMIDDDTKFEKRCPLQFRKWSNGSWISTSKEKNLCSSSNIEPGDFELLFKDLSTALDYYAHVSIDKHFANNSKYASWSEVGRIGQNLGYNREVFLAEKIDFSNTEMMEEFNVTLQLLTLGYPNLICHDWCASGSIYNSSGGCSTYRTTELERIGANILADKFPGIFKIQNSLHSNETGVKVFIGWRKALLSSTERAYQ